MNTMKHLRKAAAVLFASVLCCAATAAMTGCSESSSRTKVNNGLSEGGSVYVPEVPSSRVDETLQGKDINAVIGETVKYEDKLEITLNKVVEVDDVDKTKYRVLLAEMTIVNKTDKKIDCQTLTHFLAKIDGEDQFEPVKDVHAGIAARKYYTKIGSTLKTFNQEIAGGESLTGYVYLSMPPTWKTLQLVYTPYKYYNTDHIFFEIKETELEHYNGLLG